jgi:hypothetical protein
MAQTSKIGTHKTTVEGAAYNVAVTYHFTRVVIATPSQIILNTGGWFTVTTKLRMNQASNEFNLGYEVYQRKGTWYVDYKGKTYEFTSNSVTLER